MIRSLNRRVLLAAASALAVMMFAMPFQLAGASGAKCLGMIDAEVVFIGAVLDAADAAYDLTDDPMPVPDAAIAQERRAVGINLASTARYETTYGMLNRGVAQGVGVPREAERPPASI